MDFSGISTADFDRLNNNAEIFFEKYYAVDRLPLSEQHNLFQNEIFANQYVIADVARQMRYLKVKKE